VSLAVSSAHANGAFPEAGQLLVREDLPARVIVGANYGLLVTEDGGALWQYACETALVEYGMLYQLGAGSRLFAVSRLGLVYTDDLGCNWKRSGGTLAEVIATNAFVNPLYGNRVLAIASGVQEEPTAHESTDGGRTFGPALLRLPSAYGLASVETAASNPDIMYIVGGTFDATGPLGSLWRSADAGKSWAKHDFTGDLARAFTRIITVDRSDPNRLLLRVSQTGADDGIAVSTDGGATFEVVVRAAGTLTASLLRKNGEFWVAGDRQDLYVSSNRGDSFEARQLGISVRGLAERDGVVYAIADARAQGPTLFRSSDDGKTWEPFLSTQSVQKTRDCVAAVCRSWCRSYSGVGLWSENVCKAAPAPVGNSGPDAEDDAGCQCTTPSAASFNSLAAPVLVIAGAGLLLARRRRAG
jgi:photosystem II stability/assembly factor-like uncharacterized protein